MPTNTLNELVTEFQAKSASFKTLVNKDHALTQEDVVNARAMKNECDNLQNRINEFQSVGALKADAESYERFLKEPVRTVPFDNGANPGGGGANEPAPFMGRDGAALPGNMKLLASWLSGQTEVDYRNQETVWEDGDGIFGAKAWKVVGTPDYKSAFRQYLRHGKDLEFRNAKSYKLLQEGVDDQGGYLVPLDLINRVVQRKPTPTRVSGMVANITTSRDWLEMMKVNYFDSSGLSNIYTTGFRVKATGENPSSATAARVNDANLFGTIKIPINTYMITGVLTNNMIEDASINILQWMSDKFSETIDILRDDQTINGVGGGFSKGILLNPSASDGNDVIKYIPSGDPVTLTPDSLINAFGDIPEQYEDNCRWVFNKTSTFRTIRGFKDLNNRYLFGMGYQDSGLATPTKPTDLLGYPYVYSGLMPNVAANAFPVIFGDLQGYQLVNRVGFSVQVLRELYAESNQVALVGRIRFGGLLIEPWRLRAIKCATS